MCFLNPFTSSSFLRTPENSHDAKNSTFRIYGIGIQCNIYIYSQIFYEDVWTT